MELVGKPAASQTSTATMTKGVHKNSDKKEETAEWQDYKKNAEHICESDVTFYTCSFCKIDRSKGSQLQEKSGIVIRMNPFESPWVTVSHGF